MDKIKGFMKEKYKDYIMLIMDLQDAYLILSDEEKAFIYRDGYIEAGGNFEVYKYENGKWNLCNDGFGSPTYQALYIGDLSNLKYTKSKYKIVELKG